MAHIISPVFSNVTGKIGDVVFYRRGGEVYVRKAPAPYKRQPSILQQVQRVRLAQVVAFYRSVGATFLLNIWKRAVKIKYGHCNSMNMFIKHNIAAFDGNQGLTDYAKLHFSFGRLPQGDCFKAVLDSGGERLLVTWDEVTYLSRLRNNDSFMAVVLYETERFFVVMPGDTGAVRQDNRATIWLPASPEQPIAVYCFFTNTIMTDFSNDYYCKIDRSNLK